MGCNESKTVKKENNFDTVVISDAPKEIKKSREIGICVIEIVEANHLPNMDIGSLTDAYVVAKFISDANAKGKKSDLTLHTGTCNNTLNPVFKSYLPFPFIPLPTDVLMLKIIDEDMGTADDRIGTAKVDFSALNNNISTIEIVLSKEAKALKQKQKIVEPSTITVRLVQCGPPPPGPVRKKIFMIRHGESKWNESQGSSNVKGMVQQYDHELTEEGIKQASSFNAKWKRVRDSGPSSEQEGRDLESFLSAGEVFASPLTRAVETALLTCEDHPALLAGKGGGQGRLTLLRNLREVKNFGSFDTVGKFSGDDIAVHVRDILVTDVGEQRCSKLMTPQIVPLDSFGPWWTPLEAKDSKKDVKHRIMELFSYLRYGTDCDTVVLVGHSHFFRFVMQHCLSAEYATSQGLWCKELQSKKLDNGSALLCTLEWNVIVDAEGVHLPAPHVTHAALVFDSQLVSDHEEAKSGEAAQQVLMRPEGLFVLEVVRCNNLPNMDVGSLTDPFVVVSVQDPVSHRVVYGTERKTSVFSNSLDPEFHSFQVFPFVPEPTDIIHLMVMDEDTLTSDDLVGSTSLSLEALALDPAGVTVDVVLTKEARMNRAKQASLAAPTITVRLVQCGPPPPGPVRKKIFMIRHGESKWNESQGSSSVKGMVQQYDHELTEEGIKQASSFNAKWKRVRDSGPSSEQEGRDLESFLSAGEVFASPLTRAVETALLTCEDHPALLAGKGGGQGRLTLLRNLREVKNFGSFDTVGKFSGDVIHSHVQQMLAVHIRSSYNQMKLASVQVIPFDCYGQWWTPLEVKESKMMVKQRCDEVWALLRYGTTADTVVLVGHSHFFRFMMQEYLADSYEAESQQWCHKLKTHKLDNGSAVACEVEWSGGDEVGIVAASLVFGSQLVADKH